MPIVRISTALRNAMADQVTALVDGGASPGTLTIYDGAMPASVDDPITGTQLAAFTLADPAVAAAAAGVAAVDFDPDLVATVEADGTPTHFRIADSTGAGVLDGDVGNTASTAALKFASVAWTTGGTVTLTEGTVTQPASTA